MTRSWLLAVIVSCTSATAISQTNPINAVNADNADNAVIGATYSDLPPSTQKESRTKTSTKRYHLSPIHLSLFHLP
jgi:hypothetical protein